MRKYLAEFIGTFALTFAACGAAAFTGGFQGYLGIVGIALLFGTVFIAMFYSIGNISGCHINPAVSIAMLASGRMKVLDCVGYVIAQLIGGIAGAFTVYGLSKSFDSDVVAKYSSYGTDFCNPATNGYGDQSALWQIKPWGAVLVEIILSFIFVITVLGVTANERYKSVAGMVIGMSLTAVHLFGVLLTGTGVNPARSFGPALVKFITGDKTAMSQVWVFILAPLVGGLIAAAIYMLLTYEKNDDVIAICADEDTAKKSVTDKADNSDMEDNKDKVDNKDKEEDGKAGDKEDTIDVVESSQTDENK